MKILVVGPTRYHYTRSTVDAIRSLGYEVDCLLKSSFYEDCSYIQRKLYKCGMVSLENKWNEKWEEVLFEKCIEIERASSDLPCLIVLGGAIPSKSALKRMAKFKKILCTWDSIRRGNEFPMERLRYFDKVQVFEAGDIDFLKKYNIEAQYMPVGYDDKVFYNRYLLKDIDISFVGMPSNDRLNLLDNVAEYAEQNGFVLYVAGIWYDAKYIWKKYQFKKRHPKLYKCIDNRIISAHEAANIYSRSKISLNVSIAEHKSINPRAFEIMASNSCLFMNSGMNLRGMLTAGKDFVEFSDAGDMLSKLKNTLGNEKYRNNISISGNDSVRDRFSLKKLYGDMLSEFCRIAD